jgi:hypothetical protein
MDPNETLRLLRANVAREQDGRDGSHAEEICEYFQALDEWISKGGFLPAEWVSET